MKPHILCDGPPPLTTESADAALEMIHFIAAAVRGFDAIDVTNAVRPLWRAHLASCYSHLPIETKYWYVNAPAMLAQIMANWPYLDPWTRSALLQQWNMELPNMLWMLEPVLAEAHAAERNESTRALMAAMRQEASSARPANAASQADPVTQLNRLAQQRAQLGNFSTRMTGMTIGLMNAMKR
jgi:hypothetical protein